jgi:hypothetical protein
MYEGPAGKSVALLGEETAPVACVLADESATGNVNGRGTTAAMIVTI